MKTIVLTTLVLISVAFRIEDKGALKITLSNIKKTGKIHIAVYRDGDSFPNEKLIVKSSLAESANGKCDVLFDEVPYGSYAVAIYQDVNGNGKLDKGMFGIPDEPFAFSNNFRPKFGGPSFEKCKFDFKENNQLLSIQMINSLFGGE